MDRSTDVFHFSPQRHRGHRGYLFLTCRETTASQKITAFGKQVTLNQARRAVLFSFGGISRQMKKKILLCALCVSVVNPLLDLGRLFEIRNFNHDPVYLDKEKNHERSIVGLR
jgi:hypothetical protein